MSVCQRGHEMAGHNIYRGTNGKTACRTCRNNRSAARRQGVSLTDGLEAEYGPAPARVLNADWYDWAAVERTVRGRPLRRNLTPPELVEVERRAAA